MHCKLSIATIAIVIVIILFIFWWVAPREQADMQKLNAEYDQLKKTNSECVLYLQKLSNIPLWRVSLMAATFFVGGCAILLGLFNMWPQTGQHYGALLIFYILTFFFVYHLLSFRNFHVMCSDNCVPHWDAI